MKILNGDIRVRDIGGRQLSRSRRLSLKKDGDTLPSARGRADTRVQEREKKSFGVTETRREGWKAKVEIVGEKTGLVTTRYCLEAR